MLYVQWGGGWGGGGGGEGGRERGGEKTNRKTSNSKGVYTCTCCLQLHFWHLLLEASCDYVYTQ